MAKKGVKRKRQKKTKITSKNITNKIFVSCSFLLILVVLIFVVSYYLFGTDLFKIGVNSTTANYISFNDFFDSDTIKINNLKQLSDKNGKKSKYIDLDIKGDNDNLEYELVLIPINTNVDYSFINYYLTDYDDNEIKFDSLNKSNLSDDYSGYIIYNGMIKNKNDKLKLRVWINEDYSGDISSNSFEVKIKLK